VKTLWDWARRRSRAEKFSAAVVAVAAVLAGLVASEAAIRAHLSDPDLQAPTRIYARPFVLYVGMWPSRAVVEEQLETLGYVRAGRGDVGPGEYRLVSGTWVIGRRPFRHHDKLNPGGTAIARLDYRGRIIRLEDESGRSLSYVTLEPELVGSFLGISGRDRTPVRLSDIPQHLVEAVLSIEDGRFFEHRGLDVRRIAAASLVNMRAGRVVQGASTITQQLVRNLFLSPRRTLDRKVREAAIALALERRHSKEEILEAYLNEVYLGQDGGTSIHGVGRAAQHYFGVDVTALDLAESATLAALISGPSIYSPHRRPDAVKARRDLVLKQMLDRGVIAEEAYREAMGAPLDVKEPQRSARSARYFIDYVGDQLRDEHGWDALSTGGLAVFTMLDMRLQRAAEQAVREELARLEEQSPYLARDDSPIQAALVAIDPRSGEILAMVGGRDYGSSQFNRAVKARRQPGSSFKPIVAMAALSRDGWSEEDQRPFTLATVLHDEPLVVETPQGPWQPVNYDERFRGPVALRDALERSLNVPFARLGMAVGPERIVATARTLGIEGPLIAVPSIALGSNEVTPLELTRAYGVFATGGYRAVTRAMFGVLDRDGNVISRDERNGEQVYDPAETFLVTDALRGAVDRGTGRGLRSLGFSGDVAAKSGTTNDFRDGWFIAYTPSLAVGVWVGFDDGRTIGLPGARVALPIVARFLVSAIGPYGEVGPYGGARFSYPDGIEVVAVDPSTGLRGGPGCSGRAELFLAGTAPSESCSPWWRFDRYRREDGSRLDEEIARLRLQLQRLLERRARGNR
jgi:penicillin-binding protein 1B